MSGNLEIVVDELIQAIGHKKFRYDKVAYEVRAGKCVARYVFKMPIDFAATLSSLFD